MKYAHEPEELSFLDAVSCLIFLVVGVVGLALVVFVVYFLLAWTWHFLSRWVPLP